MDGVVTDARRLYKDVHLPERVGFARSGSPLTALLLLYEATVVYFPPAGKADLERRFGAEWNDLLELVELGSIKPIIGHPTHYARKGHFDDLFSFRPPSVWARGDELARRFADADSYWDQARAVLPISEMLQLAWVRRKFRKHFPSLSQKKLSERIEIELITNFVDLCIYGWSPLAHRLAGLPNVSHGARRILELSEILTYPTLIGMGGTPNYGLKTMTAIQSAVDEPVLLGLDRSERRLVDESARLLVDGLDLSFPSSLDLSLVAQFHEDGMSRRLWRAMEALESEVSAAEIMVTDGLVDRAVIAEEILTGTLREVQGPGLRAARARTSRRSRAWTDFTIKIGSAAALSTASAVLGQDWLTALASGAAGVTVLWPTKVFDRSIDKVEKEIIDAVTERRAGAFATQLWWLSNWRRQHPSSRTWG
ncbi:hypothetical protein EV646_116130 [Kribbella antiqua]|uniref:Uncharacterized protein n=2 Tax=Kribbella antiqua TaxID=2512217 RepID=A0A4R2IBE9_9ACTN|nr:hypothetical protein EV646_116130 [Kribbella antiqua]